MNKSIVFDGGAKLIVGRYHGYLRFVIKYGHWEVEKLLLCFTYLPIKMHLNDFTFSNIIRMEKNQLKYNHVYNNTMRLSL